MPMISPRTYVDAREYRAAKKVVMGYEQAIRAKREAKQQKAAKKLIGVCFQFKNSYSPDQSWIEYGEVVGVTDSGQPIVNLYAIDSYGAPTIEQKDWYLDTLDTYAPEMPNGQNKRISREEFEVQKSIVAEKFNLYCSTFIQPDTTNLGYEL